jgi:flagellar biosynthesis protein FliQ
MTDWVLDISHRAIWVTVIIAAPLLLSGLFTGLFISLIQAVTQINEQTLSFIPKVVVILGVLVVASPWIIDVLSNFTIELITSIPSVVNN